MMKMPACNKQFCEMAAITRPKVCVNLQVMRPSEQQWKPRQRQAAWRCTQAGDSAADNAVKVEHLRQRGKICKAVRAGKNNKY